ncbi:hypothetical protein MAR_006893 [Mya arenaria]|uniref:Uncharacterized protein n=1 Tax=Mya arenaria TaxID=6604 RepID=A0ABY7D9U4_MYAAR|nr:hypothetical protein MAR_006893 [Mya arenaria]
MQARHSVKCKLDKCTIESEEDVRQMGVEMENQPDLQMVAPMPASPDYTTFITLSEMTVSAGMFTRLVSMVIQARHSVRCTLEHCTIESEDDVRQMEDEMEYQSTLQMVALLPASPDYTTFITLSETTVSAGMFTRLVSMVIQARHSVRCTLEHCTIESEDDVRQMEDEMEYQSTLQMVALLPASPDYTKYITLACMPVLAGVFIRLVTRHSVNCTLDDCTIESEEESRQMEVETENQPGLQVVDPLPASPGYKTRITLKQMSVSAGLIRRLVSMVIQARHSVNCTLDKCRIKSEEESRQMEVETENQPVLQMVDPLPASPDYTTHIELTNMSVSAGLIRRLVSMVIQARHSVDCSLYECTAYTYNEISQMKAEMESQPLLKVREFRRFRHCQERQGDQELLQKLRML